MEIEKKLSFFPSSPGVYLMKDADGTVLYCGKANSLSDRVRSYFQQGAQLTPKIRSMVSRVADIEVIVTGSELEALILENNLIKRYRPRYNVILRDDKNYPYLRLPIKEDFPRFEVVRRIARDGALYYGPYVPAGALRETLKVIHKGFPLATCTIDIDGKAERACIEFQMKRCMAPCIGNQTKEEYHEIVAQARLFLEGKDQELLAQLRSHMQAEADRLNFEEAAWIRDRIRKIERVLERQRITVTDFVDRDVMVLVREGGHADLQVLFIRGGMLIGRKDFFMESVGESPDEEIYASFIQQFYNREGIVPPEILLPLSLPDRGLLEKWLSRKRGGSVHLLSPSRGRSAHLLTLARENAEVALAEQLRVRDSDVRIVHDVKELLGLTRLPMRVEAFDISNISGDQAVGSLVVFERGRAVTSLYRHFRIKTIMGANDFGMIGEVVFRRYRRMKEEGGNLPDLILIDGGKGQLQAAREALSKAGVTDVDLIGLAKERGKKGERVFLPGEREARLLSDTAPTTHLLQRIRDEAHRFAISYHRKLRGKALIQG